jgi:hypothetical protein
MGVKYTVTKRLGGFLGFAETHMLKQMKLRLEIALCAAMLISTVVGIFISVANFLMS